MEANNKQKQHESGIITITHFSLAKSVDHSLESTGTQRSSVQYIEWRQGIHVQRVLDSRSNKSNNTVDVASEATLALISA